MTPKVSIIIPTYNAQEHLKECLDSVVNQTLKDIEIICIDDKSTDNTVEILKEYSSKDNRFTIIEQDINQGPGTNRNIALKKATGEYIMFIDSDDMFEPTACEEAYNQISKNNNDIAFFNHYKYQNETSQKEECQEHRIILDVLNSKNSTNIDVDDAYYCQYCWDKIYNHNFIKSNQCQFAETISGEARIFSVKTILCSKSISILNKPLYCYRIYSKENKSRKSTMVKRVEQFSKSHEGRKQLYDIIKKEPYNLFSKLALIDLIKTLLGVYSAYSRVNKSDNALMYSKTREILLDINSKYDIEDIKKGIKYISPKSNLSVQETDVINETQTDKGIVVINIDKKKYNQYKNFIKYKNYFAYKMFTDVLPNLRKKIFPSKNKKK